MTNRYDYINKFAAYRNLIVRQCRVVQSLQTMIVAARQSLRPSELKLAAFNLPGWSPTPDNATAPPAVAGHTSSYTASLLARRREELIREHLTAYYETNFRDRRFADHVDAPDTAALNEFSNAFATHIASFSAPSSLHTTAAMTTKIPTSVYNALPTHTPLPGVQGVDRVHCRDLTVERFIKDYEQVYEPVLIGGCADDWAATKKWSKYQLTKGDYRNVKFKCGEDDAGYSIKLRLKFFLQYCHTQVVCYSSAYSHSCIRHWTCFCDLI
jgi:hypothetical protein